MTKSYEEAVAKKMHQEMVEFERDPRARAQAQLDNWVETQRQSAADEARFRRNLDPYNYGHWR